MYLTRTATDPWFVSRQQTRTKTPRGRRTANLEAIFGDGHFTGLALSARRDWHVDAQIAERLRPRIQLKVVAVAGIGICKINVQASHARTGQDPNQPRVDRHP